MKTIPVLTLSTDGSLLASNGIKAAACSVVIAPDNYMNMARVVSSTRSSTTSEIEAIFMATTYAYDKKIKNVCISSDSQCAILVLTESMHHPIASSNKLQSVILKDPSLENIFNQMYSKSKFFVQLSLVFSVAHGRIFDSFTQLNACADQLAKSVAKEAIIKQLPSSVHSPTFSEIKSNLDLESLLESNSSNQPGVDLRTVVVDQIGEPDFTDDLL